MNHSPVMFGFSPADFCVHGALQRLVVGFAIPLLAKSLKETAVY
jgi:hypothetical protein